MRLGLDDFEDPIDAARPDRNRWIRAALLTLAEAPLTALAPLSIHLALNPGVGSLVLGGCVAGSAALEAAASNSTIKLADAAGARQMRRLVQLLRDSDPALRTSTDAEVQQALGPGSLQVEVHAANTPRRVLSSVTLTLFGTAAAFLLPGGAALSGAWSLAASSLLLTATGLATGAWRSRRVQSAATESVRLQTLAQAQSQEFSRDRQQHLRRIGGENQLDEFAEMSDQARDARRIERRLRLAADRIVAGFSALGILLPFALNYLGLVHLPPEQLVAVGSFNMVLGYHVGQLHNDLSGLPAARAIARLMKRVRVDAGDAIKQKEAMARDAAREQGQALTDGQSPFLEVTASRLQRISVQKVRVPTAATASHEAGWLELDFDVDLRQRGRVVFLTGETGVGKTRLWKILSGEETPAHGRVLVDGIDVRRLDNSYRQALGFAEQDAPLDGHTAADALRAGSGHTDTTNAARILMNFGVLPTIAEETAEEFASRLERTRISTLSGGQRSGVSVASRLANSKSRLLFLDEPTAGLDRLTARNVMSSIDNFAAETGTIVIVTGHALPTVGGHQQIVHLARHQYKPEVARITANCPPFAPVPEILRAGENADSPLHSTQISGPRAVLAQTGSNPKGHYPALRELGLTMRLIHSTDEKQLAPAIVVSDPFLRMQSYVPAHEVQKQLAAMGPQEREVAKLIAKTRQELHDDWNYDWTFASTDEPLCVISCTKPYSAIAQQIWGEAPLAPALAL